MKIIMKSELFTESIPVVDAELLTETAVGNSPVNRFY